MKTAMKVKQSTGFLVPRDDDWNWRVNIPCDGSNRIYFQYTSDEGIWLSIVTADESDFATKYDGKEITLEQDGKEPLTGIIERGRISWRGAKLLYEFFTITIKMQPFNKVIRMQLDEVHCLR